MEIEQNTSEQWAVSITYSINMRLTLDQVQLRGLLKYYESEKIPVVKKIPSSWKKITIPKKKL